MPNAIKLQTLVWNTNKGICRKFKFAILKSTWAVLLFGCSWWKDLEATRWDGPAFFHTQEWQERWMGHVVRLARAKSTAHRECWAYIWVSAIASHSTLDPTALSGEGTVAIIIVLYRVSYRLERVPRVCLNYSAFLKWEAENKRNEDVVTIK